MKTVSIKLQPEDISRIETLKIKWNIKTATKIFIKALDIAYQEELKKLSA